MKVEEITDDQVPGLIEKATKFCQAKLKVGFPVIYDLTSIKGIESYFIK